MGKCYAKLGEIKFGKLDAYTEFIEYGKDMYKSLFFACPSFHVEKFLSGECYYIHGEKGSGKTALLKYVEVMATENHDLIEYIRFKKDIDEDDRNRIKRAGLPIHPFEEIIESDIPSDVSIDCVLAWQVYIIKCIINRVSLIGSGVFVRDKSWDELVTLIKCAYPSETINFKKILPTIKKGNISLSIGESLGIDLDLEWDNKVEKTIKFNTFAKKIISLYRSLSPTNTACYVLIDELELVYLKKKKYERDVALIRDLIQAVYYINEISKVHMFKVRVIACIRNEVYRSIQAIGMEINKMIQDYGVSISWIQHGGSIDENPLIQMLNNRLLQSQPKEIREHEISVWNVYFDESFASGKSVKNYIIDQTWNKPRDITRLFMLIQKRSEENTKIGKADFDAIRADYSDEAWQEFSNELSAKYNQEEINGIKQVLTGINIPFSREQFTERIKIEKDLFESVRLLSEKRKPADVLADLYRVGVIGNAGKLSRFVFKGHETFDPLDCCTIHYPLRRFFSAKAFEE